MNTLSCNVLIKHFHNNAVNSLEALSFKMLSTEIKIEIQTLFSSGLTPSQAYNEFLRNLQSNSEDELNFKVSSSWTIATGNFAVGMVLKCSINLRKELMSLWNLTKVLIFPTNLTTKIRT